MNKLKELKRGSGGSYILPFVWMRGEDNDIIGEELDRIQACGIREVCLESRPHPDFMGPLWWHNLDFIMAEARKRQMRVWVLDDSHFPTGFANGAFREKHPDKAKVYLAERHMDIVGPKKDNAVLISPFLGDDGRLVAVLASRKTAPETTVLSVDDVIVLTGRVSNGFVYLDIPEGRYRLSVIFTTQKGGGQEHYMNLIDRESVKVLIDTVYEPHYERYAADFGHTFAGFFSDEPELGNASGYDFHELPGRPDKKLPWSSALETRLRGIWEEDFAVNLVALWFDVGPETVRIRTEYMDAVSDLVYECFSGQIGQWCGEHHVEYIGHIIEDDNAHARLGCSIGHYFKEMRGQHRAGVDVVHFQIVPGFEEKNHQWMTWDSDGEFFHYGLAKLGSSAAHIDPNKHGRSLCEIFGNYGWALGVSGMQWLTNHMLVRGINHFTPHAFSMKFPDRDCPPHFYARGNNPQFKHFTYLMKYMNRVCHLMNGGRHQANAAVLYHGEASWGGGAHMLFQKPGRALMEHQLDYDVVPEYLLDTEQMAENTVCVRDGRLVINEEEYPCLVLPYCEEIPDTVMAFVEKHPHLTVFMADRLPKQTTHGYEVSEAFKAAVRVVSLESLADHVRALGTVLDVWGDFPHLRTFVYAHEDGTVYMLFNEDTHRRCDTVVTLKQPWRSVVRYDALNNRAEEVWAQESSGGVGPGFGEVKLHVCLEPGEAVIFIGSDVIPECSELRTDIACSRRALEETGRMELLTDWKVSLKAAGLKVCNGFEYKMTLKAGERLPNMNGPEMFPEFSGTYRYEGGFFLEQGVCGADRAGNAGHFGATGRIDNAGHFGAAGRIDSAGHFGAAGRIELHLPDFGDCAEIFINGVSAAVLLSAPGRADITSMVRNGFNAIIVEVTNTLVWQVKDPVSVFMQVGPTGMLKNPQLVFYACK